MDLPACDRRFWGSFELEHFNQNYSRIQPYTIPPTVLYHRVGATTVSAHLPVYPEGRHSGLPLQFFDVVNFLFGFKWINYFFEFVQINFGNDDHLLRRVLRARAGGRSVAIAHAVARSHDRAASSRSDRPAGAFAVLDRTSSARVGSASHLAAVELV